MLPQGEQATTEKRGLTLIELLVVTLIVGLLAAVAVPVLLNEQKKGQDASAKSNANSTASQLDSCYLTTRNYRLCDNPDRIISQTRKMGPNAGRVAVTPNKDGGYKVTVVSRSGDRFVITKANGTPVRTCSNPGNGGCPQGGDW